MPEFLPAHSYNFAAVPIEMKRSWVEGVPGAAVVHGEASRFTTLGENASSAEEDLTRHLNGLQVDWRGPASDASQAQLRAVGAGMDATSSVTGNGSQRLNDYGDSFSNMANQIVYDDPAKAGWWDSFTRSDAWQAAVGVLDSRLSFSQVNQQNSAQADHALTVHAANAAEVASRFGTDTGPGTRWPGDAPPGGGQGGGAPSFGGATTGSGNTAVSASDGAGSGTGGGSGAPSPATSPARFEPPSPQVAGPQPGAPHASTPGTTSPPSGAAPTGAPPMGPQPTGAPPMGPQPTGARPTGVAPSGASPSGAGSPDARPSVGQASVPPPSDPQTTAPRADSNAMSETERAARFQDSLRNRQMPVPAPFGAGAPTGSTGGLSYGRSGGAGGRGTPAPRPRSGGGGTGGWGGTGGGSGGGYGASGGGSGVGSWRGASGSSPGSGPLSEPGGNGARGAGARPGIGEGPAGTRLGGDRGAGGYGPMMGGAGAGATGGQEHRNRYLVPSDEVFALPLVATDPVLGPEEDERR